jgi:hypothetical protein
LRPRLTAIRGLEAQYDDDQLNAKAKRNETITAKQAGQYGRGLLMQFVTINDRLLAGGVSLRRSTSSASVSCCKGRLAQRARVCPLGDRSPRGAPGRGHRLRRALGRNSLLS